MGIVNENWLDRQLAAEDLALDARARLLRERPMKGGSFSFSREVTCRGREVKWVLRQGTQYLHVGFSLEGVNFLYGGIAGLRHLAAEALTLMRRELLEERRRQSGLGEEFRSKCREVVLRVMDTRPPRVMVVTNDFDFYNSEAVPMIHKMLNNNDTLVSMIHERSGKIIRVDFKTGSPPTFIVPVHCDESRTLHGLERYTHVAILNPHKPS